MIYMSNKKKRLLISLAIVCAEWGEVADFEFKEVVIDGGFYKDVQNVYGLAMPTEKDFPDPDGDDYKAACEKWKNGLKKIQEELVGLLVKIKESHR